MDEEAPTVHVNQSSRNVDNAQLLQITDVREIPDEQLIDVAILNLIIDIPAGPRTSIEDFFKVNLESLSFMNEEIEANETVIVEGDTHNQLDLNRLLDANDDYNEILYNEDR